MYEGKLVAAVLQAKSKVRLRYEYNDAAGKALGVRVVGRLPGEEDERDIFGTVADWETSGDNSPWGKPGNWRRQLAYRGAREWARLHDPSALLGVYADDEFDDVEAKPQTIEAKPKPLLTSSFPTQAKAASKPEKKAPARKESHSSEPEPEVVGVSVVNEEKPNRLSVREFLENVTNPAANIPALIDEVCFEEGKLVVDNEELAQIWIAASTRIAATLDEGMLQALSAFGRAKTLDEIDDLATRLEAKIWFKGLAQNQKSIVRQTVFSIRQWRDFEGFNDGVSVDSHA
jgi:hypothetical protein